MDIGFLWDEEKYKAVQKKHKFQLHEGATAFYDPKGYEIPDPRGHEDRWMWVGSTRDGRVLSIIFSDEELPIYRLITAFKAEKEVVDEYYTRSGI